MLTVSQNVLCESGSVILFCDFVPGGHFVPPHDHPSKNCFRRELTTNSVTCFGFARVKHFKKPSAEQKQIYKTGYDIMWFHPSPTPLLLPPLPLV